MTPIAQVEAMLLEWVFQNNWYLYYLLGSWLESIHVVVLVTFVIAQRVLTLL